MNRTELIFATATVLFIAFCLGWFVHWIVHKFVKVQHGDMTDVDQMAAQLNDAELQRDQAITYFQQTERDMKNQLSQAEAELSAAMDGLREARQEAEELRTYIEKIHKAR